MNGRIAITHQEPPPPPPPQPSPSINMTESVHETVKEEEDLENADVELEMPKEPKINENDLNETFRNRKKWLLECSKVIYHNRVIKEKRLK